MTTPALMTDKYELTMLSSLLESGIAQRRGVFELFARRLPRGRRFGVVAGLGRLIEALPDFRFSDQDLEWLVESGALTEAAADHLSGWAFGGDINAYPEGSLYWPGSPVLTISGTVGDAMLLETLALSIFNHDSAVASAAARMVLAAQGRPIIEMGSRRVHEHAAQAAARAAYIAGFASTSNLAAGRRWGIPVVGTAAHAFTLAHRTEREAFDSQIDTHGVNTSLLVDTYDTPTGIRTAVEAARAAGATGPGAVRLDSGDLLTQAHAARALLDELGAVDTLITVTSDLDEYLMTELSAAPIDGYGAGTRVATGSGHPTAGMVYKLVAVADDPDPQAPLRPVAKKASGKVSVGGAKTAYRYADGTEGYTLDGTIPTGARPVQIPVVRSGQIVHQTTLEQVRSHTAEQLLTLPDQARLVSDGEPYRTTERQK